MQSGASPLFVASQKDQADVVTILLNAGAKLDLVRKVSGCMFDSVHVADMAVPLWYCVPVLMLTGDSLVQSTSRYTCRCIHIV